MTLKCVWFTYSKASTMQSLIIYVLCIVDLCWHWHSFSVPPSMRWCDSMVSRRTETMTKSNRCTNYQKRKPGLVLITFPNNWGIFFSLSLARVRYSEWQCALCTHVYLFRLKFINVSPTRLKAVCLIETFIFYRSEWVFFLAASLRNGTIF